MREGLLERRKCQDRPVRYEYRLTDKGRDFYPVMAAIVRWGDRWLDEGKGAPVLLRHRTCGQVTRAEVVCAECKQPLTARNVTVEPGPGFPQERLELPAVSARFGGGGANSPQ